MRTSVFALSGLALSGTRALRFTGSETPGNPDIENLLVPPVLPPPVLTGPKRTAAPGKNRWSKAGFAGSLVTMVLSFLGGTGMITSLLPENSKMGPVLQNDTVLLNAKLKEVRDMQQSAVPEIQQEYARLLNPADPADNDQPADALSALARTGSALDQNQDPVLDRTDPYTTHNLYQFYRDLGTLASTPAESEAIDRVLDTANVFSLGNAFSSSDGSHYNEALQEAATQFQALGITHLGEKPAQEKAILTALTDQVMGKRLSPQMVTRYKQFIDDYYTQLDTQQEKISWLKGLGTLFGLSMISTLGLAIKLDRSKD